MKMIAFLALFILGCAGFMTSDPIYVGKSEEEFNENCHKVKDVLASFNWYHLHQNYEGALDILKSKAKGHRANAIHPHFNPGDDFSTPFEGSIYVCDMEQL